MVLGARGWMAELSSTRAKCQLHAHKSRIIIGSVKPARVYFKFEKFAPMECQLSHTPTHKAEDKKGYMFLAMRI